MYCDSGGRLNEHHHGSTNTHLIFDGDMEIGKSRNDELRFRSVYKGAPGEVVVDRELEYMAVAGPKGCKFVEGHTVLSPTSAIRFEMCKTNKKCRRNEDGAFPTVEH